MARTDRRAFREALGAAMGPVVAGTGKPAQKFFDHTESDFGSASPVICLSSRATTPLNLTVAESRFEHRYLAYVWVTRDDPVADDTLDDCYQAVADFVEANKSGSSWKVLDFDGPSTIFEDVWGGDPYWVEQIPLKIQGM